MANRLSRISLVIEGEGGSESQGSLTAAAAGFGLFQTWLYATAFGTMGVPYDVSLFNLQAVSWLPMPPVFFVSAVSIGIVLVVLGVLAQRKLKWFAGKPVVIASSVVLAAATFFVLEVDVLRSMDNPMYIVVGLALGLGSALLTLFWGAAFSRLGTVSIAINTAFATVGATVLYACMVRLIPFGFDKWIVVLLPLLQIPFALRAAPRSLAEAHSVPVFDVLPVKGGSLAVRFGLSMLLFGIALGMLRSITSLMIREDIDTSLQLIALVLAVIPAVLLLANMLRHEEGDRWDSLFKPLVLVVGVTACVAPLLLGSASGLSLFLSFAGYLSFEVSMWVFFTGLAQEFRLSPVFLVGVGRGVLSVGSLLGMCVVMGSSVIDVLPYGRTTIVLLVMLGIMAGYVIVPRFETMCDAARREGPAVPDADADAACAAERQAREALSAEIDAEAYGEAASSKDEGDVTAAATARLNADAATGALASSSLNGAGAASAPERVREASYDDALKVVCERIASRYLLSQRQTEVLYLLARGHTAGYVQDKLCISLSTAKSHIYNIYKKLDIHKQHELLAMVEEEMESLR